MQGLVRVLATVLLAAPASGQIAVPNAAGVAMGHLHYRVRDVEANARFWVALGGERGALGETTVITFPDVLVFLDEGGPTGGTEGSILNHMAFRVQSLEAVAAAGFEFDPPAPARGVGNVFTPEGERIELFDETATNLTFTGDGGPLNAVAQRHNAPLPAPSCPTTCTSTSSTTWSRRPSGGTRRRSAAPRACAGATTPSTCRASTSTSPTTPTRAGRPPAAACSTTSASR